MWICKKCNEENEDSFDTCYKCQTFSEEGTLKSKENQQELEKEEKKEVIKEEPKENKGNLFISLLVAFLTFIIVGIATNFSDEPFVKIIPAVASYLVFRLIRNKK